MRNHIVQLGPRRGEGQHPGLLLNRFLAVQNDDGEDKRRLIAAAGAACQSEPLRRIYGLAFQRWQANLPEVKTTVDLTTPPHARLIVGLGNKGVIDAGLRLHHTYGVPIIPGSALKGLASHYCAEVWGKEDVRYKPRKQRPREHENEEDYHQLLFGTTDDSGVICFEDAWIHPASLAQGLLKDVMTPHHQKSQTDPECAPTDFDSPVPVPFLSVAGCFHVAVCWQGPDHPQAKAWTKRSLEILEKALKEWGVGGKTSSGYGRLNVPTAPAASVRPGAVIVRVLERRPDLNGKPCFRVQEEGRAAGMLHHGTPPATLPTADVEIEVYRSNTDVRSPQYRWDAPTPPAGPARRGGPPKRR